MFPSCIVKHAPHIISDHCPIVIDTDGMKTDKKNKAKRRFKFEAMWATEEECEVVIRETWNLNAEDFVGGKMQKTGEQLVQWHHSKFRSLRREIDTLSKELQSSPNSSPNDELILQEQNKRERLNSLLEK